MNFSRSKNDREADWNCDAKAQKADWDILYRAFSAPAFSNNCSQTKLTNHKSPISYPSLSNASCNYVLLDVTLIATGIYTHIYCIPYTVQTKYM